MPAGRGGSPRAPCLAQCSSDEGRCPSKGTSETGVVQRWCATHPELCVTGVRQSPHGHEALITSLRMTTIQRCRVPSGTADGSRTRRRLTGDPRAEPVFRTRWARRTGTVPSDPQGDASHLHGGRRGGPMCARLAWL